MKEVIAVSDNCVFELDEGDFIVRCPHCEDLIQTDIDEQIIDCYNCNLEIDVRVLPKVEHTPYTGE